MIKHTFNLHIHIFVPGSIANLFKNISPISSSRVSVIDKTINPSKSAENLLSQIIDGSLISKITTKNAFRQICVYIYSSIDYYRTFCSEQLYNLFSNQTTSSGNYNNFFFQLHIISL